MLVGSLQRLSELRTEGQGRCSACACQMQKGSLLQYQQLLPAHPSVLHSTLQGFTPTVMSYAMFYGGLGQLIAGILEVREEGARGTAC